MQITLLAVVILPPAPKPKAILPLPVVFASKRINTDDRISRRQRQSFNAILTDGRVAVAGDIAGECTKHSLAVFSLPVLLLKSALSPVAAVAVPVVLFSSAAVPLAVFSVPVVLKQKRCSASGRIVSAALKIS